MVLQSGISPGFDDPPRRTLTCWVAILLVGVSSIAKAGSEREELDAVAPANLGLLGTPQQRKDLADRGVIATLGYTNDVLGNVHGGNKRGVIDQGKVEAALTLDLEKLAGWKGLTF